MTTRLAEPIEAPEIVEKRQKLEDSDDSTEKSDSYDLQGPSKASSPDAKTEPDEDGFVSKLSEYEEMFKDRYTQNDVDYVNRVNQPLEPIVMPNWSAPRQFFRRNGNSNWRGNGNPRGNAGNFQRNWGQNQGHQSGRGYSRDYHSDRRR
ncbi:unnamed protein product [Bursaphelenchus xylophilus]|uniref:(pine wood nematode) hypothetical protein n=1 Tax=Bursaphelenchus xylophilus TaxID=6326 RepID=A0A1I7SBZ5_BURXY|nr:unnamed protein product [Bursaphelenchus xylophilus]CAG9088994.1 unnamed protein product [Bursaphelenchus xylophilus]